MWYELRKRLAVRERGTGPTEAPGRPDIGQRSSVIEDPGPRHTLVGFRTTDVLSDVYTPDLGPLLLLVNLTWVGGVG